MATTKRDTAAASAAKPTRAKKADTGPDATHVVLREFNYNGERLPVGSSVYLNGLNASELESHGYVRKM